jgi:hypothetical protein
MVFTIGELLFRPDAFFSGRTGKEGNLKKAALIVLTGAIFTGALAYLIGTLTAQIFSGVGGGIGDIVAVSSVAGGILTFFISWVVVSAVFFIVSMVFKGKGKFSDTLSAVGFGALPQVFGAVISLAIAFMYLPPVHVPSIRSLENAEQIQAAVQAFMHNPAMVEFTRLSAVVSTLFLVWSSNIWIFGIRDARNLPLRNAVITVVVPVAVYIAYSLLSAFVGMPWSGF